MRLNAALGPWGSRFYVQMFSVLAFNNYFFSPPGKRTCVPVLNCYACPSGSVGKALGP